MEAADGDGETTVYRRGEKIKGLTHERAPGLQIPASSETQTAHTAEEGSQIRQRSSTLRPQPIFRPPHLLRIRLEAISSTLPVAALPLLPIRQIPTIGRPQLQATHRLHAAGSVRQLILLAGSSSCGRLLASTYLPLRSTLPQLHTTRGPLSQVTVARSPFRILLRPQEAHRLPGHEAARKWLLAASLARHMKTTPSSPGRVQPGEFGLVYFLAIHLRPVLDATCVLRRRPIDIRNAGFVAVRSE